jgi:predicted PurR-regulated permease PerM
MGPSDLKSFYARSFGIATAGLLGFLLFKLLTPFVTPLLWASLLAFMLAPLHNKLLHRKPKPALTAGFITVTAALVVLGPLSLFVFAFLRQAGELLSRFQVEAAERKLPALQLILELGPIAAVLDRVGEYTALTKAQILQSATDAAQGALQQLASLGGTVVLGAFTVASQFALTLFILFFFLRDGREILQRIVQLIPLRPAKKEELLQTLGSVTRAVVLGTLVTALVQGTLLGLGFGIAGLPSPLVFGAVGAVASLIPIVGTSLVWVPAVITLYAQGHPGWALFLLLWSLILVTGSDNVIRPLVISGNSNASTLLVFIGLLGGVSVFGVAGIFMGPFVLTLISALISFANEPLAQIEKRESQTEESVSNLPELALTQPKGPVTVDERNP